MGWPNLDLKEEAAARRHRFQSGFLLGEGSNADFCRCPAQALDSESSCGCGLARVRDDCDSGLLTTSALQTGHLVNKSSDLCHPTLLPGLAGHTGRVRKRKEHNREWGDWGIEDKRESKIAK